MIALALVSISAIRTHPITCFDAFLGFDLAALRVAIFEIGVELIVVLHSGSYFRVIIYLISHRVDEFLKELTAIYQFEL